MIDQYRKALSDLRSFGKPSYGAPAYSRFVNRPIGRRIAAGASAMGLTPNQVTAMSAVLSLAGIVLLVAVPPSLGLGFGVAVLLALGYAFDSADGQLARLTRTGSPAGEWLDHVVDMTKLVLLHSAVLISWLRFDDGFEWQLALVPLAFATVNVVAFFAWLLVEVLQRAVQVPKPVRPSGRAPVSRSLLRLPSDYGLLCLTFVLWGVQDVFIWVYGLLMLANLAILILALPVWYRQAQAITE